MTGQTVKKLPGATDERSVMDDLDGETTHDAEPAGPPARTSESFHRRVLDRLPTALIVVDEAGLIVYGNEALERIAGWTAAEGIGTGIYDYIHPEDLDWLAEAFVNLADRENRSPDVVDRPWVPLNFRLVARDGHVVPVEVIGNGALHDPDVNGIIYEVRPAYEREIVQRVLAGVATGGDLTGQLELVVELISASMIGIESAVLRVGTDRTDVLAASQDELRATLARAAEIDELSVFLPSLGLPQFHDVREMTSRFGAELVAQGYEDAWNIDVASVADDSRYRIVGFTEVHHIPAMGVRARLTWASELTSVILLRAHSDQLLDRAAHHDELTGLPNRLGLRRLVDELRGGCSDLAILFVDLDGFKSVNDDHGHEMGDDVLKTIARRLAAATGPDDLVARLGGDEFAVVLAPPTGEPFDTMAVSRRLIDAIEAPMTVDGQPALISASLGFTELTDDVDLDTALGAADRAMYSAKRAGGGQPRRGDIEIVRPRSIS